MSVHWPVHYFDTELNLQQLLYELPCTLSELSRFLSIAVSHFTGCILQRLHLKTDYSTTLPKGCPNSKAPSNAAHKCGLLFPLFGGYTATILCSLPYPKILRK